MQRRKQKFMNFMYFQKRDMRHSLQQGCLIAYSLHYLTLLHSERQKLCAILAFLSAIGIRCNFEDKSLAFFLFITHNTRKFYYILTKNNSNYLTYLQNHICFRTLLHTHKSNTHYESIPQHFKVMEQKSKCQKAFKHKIIKASCHTSSQHTVIACSI